MIHYNEYEPTLLPPWLRDVWGVAWGTALGLIKDGFLGLFESAVQARFVRSAPPDAYGHIGADRKIERGPGESEVSYVKRIAKPFSAWRWAGTDKGIRDVLSAIGLTSVIRRNNQWAVDWFTGQSKWWRQWVLLTVHPWASDGVWGDPGVWGDGGTWGSTATPQETSFVRRMVKLWKSSHAKTEVIVILDGELWGYPEGTWGDSGTWGGAVSVWPVP